MADAFTTQGAGAAPLAGSDLSQAWLQQLRWDYQAGARQQAKTAMSALDATLGDSLGKDFSSDTFTAGQIRATLRGLPVKVAIDRLGEFADGSLAATVSLAQQADRAFTDLTNQTNGQIETLKSSINALADKLVLLTWQVQTMLKVLDRNRDVGINEALTVDQSKTR